MNAEALYTECMNCSKSTECCPGTWKDIPAGVPPRGFRMALGRVDVLVVAKNPGHPLRNEREFLRGRTGEELLTGYRKFLDTIRENGPAEASGRFHRNLKRYLESFLDHKGLIRVAYTNLVKCSTREERARLKMATMRECYDTYLRREIELFKPKVLLALGKEVQGFLEVKKLDHGIPVVGIKHPSYYYPRESEHETLKEIGQVIQSALQAKRRGA